MPEQLSARWTHPEREGILTDRIGYADITSWSRGTTKAVRPEVSTPRHHPESISSLKACAEYYAKKARLSERKWQGEDVTLPSQSGNSSEVAKAIKDCDKEIKASRARLTGVDVINRALAGLAKTGGVVKDIGEPYPFQLKYDMGDEKQ